MGLDFNLLFIKMESLILAKGLSFFLQRVGFTGGILLAGIGGLFDIEMTPANMMVASGASGASSSGVNQAPLPPVPQPQPPAAELDGGGAANKNVEVGLFRLRKARRVTTLTNPFWMRHLLQRGTRHLTIMLPRPSLSPRLSSLRGLLPRAAIRFRDRL